LAAGFDEIRPVLRPAISLAIVGTVGTALIVPLAAILLFDLPLLESPSWARSSLEPMAQRCSRCYGAVDTHGIRDVDVPMGDVARAFGAGRGDHLLPPLLVIETACGPDASGSSCRSACVGAGRRKPEPLPPQVHDLDPSVRSVPPAPLMMRVIDGQARPSSKGAISRDPNVSPHAENMSIVHPRAPLAVRRGCPQCRS
jgi:hypothetical protein